MYLPELEVRIRVLFYLFCTSFLELRGAAVGLAVRRFHGSESNPFQKTKYTFGSVTLPPSIYISALMVFANCHLDVYYDQLTVY